MKLVDLDPEFIRYEGDDLWQEVSTLAEAQGIVFDCPKCFGGNLSHSVAVSFADRGVLEHQGSHGDKGQATRWRVSGTSFQDLTLDPSIDLTRSLRGDWHGWIKNGEAT